MKVQVTVVVSDGHHHSRVDSMTLLLDKGGIVDDPDVVVANAARRVARRLGLGRPTPAKEGGRG